MNKLLFVFERNMPTVSITRDTFSKLKNHPGIQSTFKYLADVSVSDINEHDIIIFIRPMDVYSWRVAKKAREAGHLVICFCDDDLLNLPPALPTIPWRKRGLRRALEQSDIIWSSSRYIADKYRGLTFGKRAICTDTILQPEELQGIDINHEGNSKIKIVYAAGAGHAQLFEEYVKPAVTELMREFGDTISWTFVGVHPKMDDNIPCKYVSGMPLLEYRKYMKESQFDIGLAPLKKDDFSKCKYFNKFIEYTTQGIAGVYSNTEPYTYVVKSGINGLLTDNTPESWADALRQMIRDKKLRKSCVENAIHYLQENHSENAVIAKLEESVPEIINNNNYLKCGHFEQFKAPYYFSRLFDWIYMTCFYFKKTGIKDVVARAKVHIKGHAYSRR